MEHTYWDNVTNKKIAILGRYPPPLGGISIHIKRVIAKLRAQKNKVAFLKQGNHYVLNSFFVSSQATLFFVVVSASYTVLSYSVSAQIIK